MIQKVIQIGTSLGVTIPKNCLKELGLKLGDKVHVFVDPLRRSMTISKYSPAKKEE